MHPAIPRASCGRRLRSTVLTVRSRSRGAQNPAARRALLSGLPERRTALFLGAQGWLCWSLIVAWTCLCRRPSTPERPPQPPRKLLTFPSVGEALSASPCDVVCFEMFQHSQLARRPCFCYPPFHHHAFDPDGNHDGPAQWRSLQRQLLAPLPIQRALSSSGLSVSFHSRMLDIIPFCPRFTSLVDRDDCNHIRLPSTTLLNP